MEQLNNDLINRRKDSNFLLQASVMILLAVFFLAIPFTVHGQESIEEPTELQTYQLTSKQQDKDSTESDNLSHHAEDTTEAVADSNDVEQPDAEENVPSLDENDENIDESTPEDEEETAESEETEQDELDEEPSDIDGDENESETDAEDTDIDADAEEDGTSEDEDVDEAEDIEESENAEENEEAEENTDAQEDVDEAAEAEEEKSSKATLSSKKGELGNGDRDERVVQLKKDLAKLGFAVPGNGTNQFGPQTTKKVKEFQKYYGLKITGTFNKETEDKLKKILATPLQKWNKHNDTIQLKKDLAFLGRPVPGNGTSSYGNDTEKTVKKFQADNGLVVNGIADEVTLKKIQELITAPLSNGMRREDVKELKKDLAKLGFAVPGNGTNRFGPQTRKKVKEFQKYYGLSQTRTVNQSTKKKLNEQVNSPFQNGKRHNDTLQLKRDLNKIGFGGITVTTLFSDFTEKRVKELQKYYGLKVTGIA